jgi:hypothetical protein
MTMRLHGAIALLITSLVAGCGSWDDQLILDNSLICTPGQPRSCWCSTGGPGHQTCHDDGRDYETCACTPDAGMTEDAGVPGDADMSRDAGVLGVDAR